MCKYIVNLFIVQPPQVGKAMNVSLQCRPRSNSTIPLPYFSFKYINSYKHSASWEYDEIAHIHQLFVALPLLFGYSAFRLVSVLSKEVYL